MSLDDIFKDSPIDIEKDIDKSRMAKLDYDITEIFMDPTHEIEPGHFIIEYTKEEVEKKLEKFKQVIQDYSRNEITAYIFWQKISFLSRVAGLSTHIAALEEHIRSLEGYDEDNLEDLI